MGKFDFKSSPQNDENCHINFDMAVFIISFIVQDFGSFLPRSACTNFRAVSVKRYFSE